MDKSKGNNILYPQHTQYKCYPYILGLRNVDDKIRQNNTSK